METRVSDFKEISPADFFYRNRDIAGFSNPVRSTYMAIRELIENSLDACEEAGILPDIYVKVKITKRENERETIELSVSDNGKGIPPEIVPNAFGQVLFGSKYILKQSRGTFGLGGKMAYLYGQITTNEALRVVTGNGRTAHEFKLMIDIGKNEPIVVSRKRTRPGRKWRGTGVTFSLEGNYIRAAPKIIEYVSETAMVAPYANITFVDPDNKMYRFARTTPKMPRPPKETLPHPKGVDVETLQRIIATTRRRDLTTFLSAEFERVGKQTATKFTKLFNLKNKDPKTLTHEEQVRLTKYLLSYDAFLPPDPSSLSPLGKELFQEGITKELNPEFVSVESRRPSSYSGHPFIVEVGIAYGGAIVPEGKMRLYRFANRIPLLYDEYSDVSWKIASTEINWRRYGLAPESDPLALFVHICSTKVPYKTVGKEYIADRPEIEHEVINGIRNVARDLAIYLSRRQRMTYEKKRMDLFEKYLPIIARYASRVAKVKEAPSVENLVKKAKKLPLFAEETA